MKQRSLSHYIIPNILAMVGISCYVLADTFFISLAEGANGITALNLVLPVYGVIYAIGAMIGVGSATRFSLKKSLGEKDSENYFTNSVVFTLIVGIIFLVLGRIFSRDILLSMGADETILAIGLDYLNVVVYFTPFFMLNFTFTAFVRNDGAPNVAMAATLISGLFNILFDYIFMFPMKMGMNGAALATGVSPVVSMLICLFHFFGRRNSIKLKLIPPSLKLLFSSCVLGTVAFVGEISMSVSTMVFNFLLLKLGGNVAVAAYGVIINIAIVATALFNGVSQGLQPLASVMHGQSDIKGEKSIYVKSMLTALAISFVLVAAVLVFAEFFVGIFNSEGSYELAEYADKGIRLYFTGFPFAAANIVTSGFYSATGRGRDSSLIAVFRGIVAIVIFAFIMAELFGITGVWLAFPVTEAFTLLFTLIFSLLSRRRSDKIN